MFTIKSLAATLLLLGSASAAPTRTTRTTPSTTVALTGVTHSVVAGLGGLRFDPDNVVAAVGDVVEWHFLPRNHSVVQSSYADPCIPLPDSAGFSSGFSFATAEGQSDQVFQIVVEDARPMWYYCSQTVGAHCQNGMVGVINQNFDSQDFTLAKYRQAAAETDTSVTPPSLLQGGTVLPNPNPDGGF
ncbi:hypothetical protein S40293_07172 [Stachybotrys chartarum IBT 40293]|nr:hypothetical protein S40293_07172 [Stachybotrys chartarum IBT 40293]